MNNRHHLDDIRHAFMPWLYYNAHRGKAAEKELDTFCPTRWGRQQRRKGSTGAEILARFRALQGT